MKFNRLQTQDRTESRLGLLAFLLFCLSNMIWQTHSGERLLLFLLVAQLIRYWISPKPGDTLIQWIIGILVWAAPAYLILIKGRSMLTPYMPSIVSFLLTAVPLLLLFSSDLWFRFEQKVKELVGPASSSSSAKFPSSS